PGGTALAKTDHGLGGGRSPPSFGGGSGRDSAVNEFGNTPGKTAADSAGGAARAGLEVGFHGIAAAQAKNCAAFAIVAARSGGNKRLHRAALAVVRSRFARECVVSQ